MKTRKYKEVEEVTVIMTDIEGVCKMLNVGKETARKVADLAEARVHLPFTKLARYNVAKIKQFIESSTY